jgi:hypothetical protein
MISNKLFQDIQTMVRGALCAECKLTLKEGAVFFSDDTTKRTVHWSCRTDEDDPQKSQPKKI